MSNCHDEAFHSILEAKYARIISEISDMHAVSFEKAMDIFYIPHFCLSLKKALLIFIAGVKNIWQKRYGESIRING